MTPRAYYALLDRHRLQNRHELYCAAVTASAVYNVNRGKNDPFITPEEFIGKDGAKPQKQSGDDMLMIVRHILNPAFNGIDKTNG